MNRLTAAALCVLLSILLFTSVPARSEGPVLRALIITCDKFLSGEDTTPAAQINARMMKEALSEDARDYAVIRTESDTIGTVEKLKEVISETFGEAADEDQSLIYISTHGLYNPARSNRTACLLLSDGETESRLYASVLENMLESVPGTRLIIIDACNSGAFIGKGLSDPADAAALRDGQNHVLCSAGGSEASWYWRSDAEEGARLYGAGYFTSILTRGLSASNGCPADEDEDGRVSMLEAARYLKTHYAASTPQLYPERDGETLLFCRRTEDAAPRSGLSDVEFEDTVFSGGMDSIRFSFDIEGETDVSYQLVYMKRGAWDFAGAQQINEPAALQTGHYERSLMLNLADEDLDVSGYMMLQIFTRGDGGTVLAESRLISVLPLEGDIALSVGCPSVFRAGSGEELAVTVRHDIPCVLTVRIQNARGETVRNLAYEIQTRPQHLVPEGTCLYWDGLTENGSRAPEGYYVVRVSTEIGNDTYTAYSMPFRLMTGSGAEG